jgi:hypothetical protein
VEHVERQDDRENEIRDDIDDLEQQGDKLEQRGGGLDEQIDETREDFEQKRSSADVPGLQEPEDEGVVDERQPAGGPAGQAVDADADAVDADEEAVDADD